MYQTDFVCTYKLLKSRILQEQLYRIQLLQAFDLEQWDDEKINTMTTDLYNNLADKEPFIQILSKANENKQIKEMLDLFAYANGNSTANSTANGTANGTANNTANNIDNDLVFRLLFKFEFFDLFHRCLVDYLLHSDLNEVYLNKLLIAF
jgi:hypothetical protein